MNRIDKKFQELKEAGKKALITFVTAGDPEPSATPRFVRAMEEAGADIIELGVPYSDPIAEGPVIQESSARALKYGIRLGDIFSYVSEIRKTSEIPILLLLYYNCIFKYGIERFFEECANVGVDGIIVPDLPVEERDDIKSASDSKGIPVITLIAPTSKERMERIVKEAKGFVYCVSSLGVTGMREGFHQNLAEFVSEIHKYTNTPRAIGFGISTPEQVKLIRNYSEGVIVGSAIVKRIGEAASVEEAEKRVKDFVGQLRKALD